MFIAGPVGRLQAVVDEPEQTPRAVAIICHPHTQYGGTLTNKVVHQLSRTFSGMGAASVRFNFRGAGESDGEYDAGNGESDDLAAVVDWSRQRWPEQPLWLAGFSFGAYVALRMAAALKPAWLVTVAPPVNLFPLDDFVRPDADWLLVQGADDEVVPASDVLHWVQQQHPPPETVVVEGAGHFFHGRLNQLQEIVRQQQPPG